MIPMNQSAEMWTDVLERLERGNDPFRGNDASHDADGERNGHDWLGRNDFVVDGEYHIGEVFLLTVTNRNLNLLMPKPKGSTTSLLQL